MQTALRHLPSEPAPRVAAVVPLRRPGAVHPLMEAVLAASTPVAANGDGLIDALRAAFAEQESPVDAPPRMSRARPAGIWGDSTAHRESIPRFLTTAHPDEPPPRRTEVAMQSLATTLAASGAACGHASRALGLFWDRQRFRLYGLAGVFAGALLFGMEARLSERSPGLSAYASTIPDAAAPAITASDRLRLDTLLAAVAAPPVPPPRPLPRLASLAATAARLPLTAQGAISGTRPTPSPPAAVTTGSIERAPEIASRHLAAHGMGREVRAAQLPTSPSAGARVKPMKPVRKAALHSAPAAPAKRVRVARRAAEPRKAPRPASGLVGREPAGTLHEALQGLWAP